jgi:membrane protease YdiL (CAAX protease family)
MDAYLELAARGRNAWWRYLAAPVVACLLAVLISLVLVFALTLLHILPPNIAEEIQQPKHVLPFFLGIGVVFGILAIGMMIAVAVVHRKKPSDIMGQWRWDLFVWGFGGWLAIQAVLSLIDWVVAPRGFSISANRDTASLAAAALVGILVQTFAEEFVFRGYVTQGFLLACKKPVPAAIASGLLFGAVHIPNGIPQALNAVVFGIVCALIVIRTGGIALTYGLHLANNYFGAVVVVSGSDAFKGSPGLIFQNTPALIWWDLCLSAGALLALLWPVFRFFQISQRVRRS